MSEIQHPLLTQPKSNWSTFSVTAALKTIDAGNMKAGADLVEIIMRDARVRGALSARVLGLLSLPIKFKPKGKELRNKQLETVSEDFKKLFPVAELQKCFSWALCFGVGLAQVIPIARKNPADSQLFTIRNWHPRWLRWEYENDGFGRWFLMTQTGEIEIKKDDPNWILVLPYGEDRPWAGGLWTSLANPWVSKQLAYANRSRNADFLGTPAKVIETSSMLSEDAANRLMSQVQNLGSNSVVSLPPGARLSLLEAGSSNGDIFESVIADSNEEMITAILGQTVTTQGQNMGFGEGTIFENVKRDLIDFDAKTYSEAVSPYLTTYAKQNTLPAPLCVLWDTTPPNMEAEQNSALLGAAQAATALNAELVKDGKRIDLVSYLEAKGIRMVVDDSPQLALGENPASNLEESEKPEKRPKDDEQEKREEGNL